MSLDVAYKYIRRPRLVEDYQSDARHPDPVGVVDDKLEDSDDRLRLVTQVHRNVSPVSEPRRSAKNEHASSVKAPLDWTADWDDETREFVNAHELAHWLEQLKGLLGGRRTLRCQYEQDPEDGMEQLVAIVGEDGTAEEAMGHLDSLIDSWLVHLPSAAQRAITLTCDFE